MAEPKVRFRKIDGRSYPAWETIPMSEVFAEISDKNHPDMPVLSVQQGVGTVLRDSSDRNIIYDKSNLKNYKAMKKDDFIIHLRSFEGGLECSNYEGISSPAYRILRPKAILPAAYRDYFRSYEFIHNKLAVSVVGIRDGKNIDMETFWQIPITIPCPEEQQKIADFLSSVDEVISTSEEEVANLETQKKAVMKKIFSQEVRFKRADGSDFPEWEEHVIRDFCKVSSGEFVIKTKQDDSYPYPVFNGGTENTGYYSEYNYDGSYILMSSRGANAGYVNKYIGKLWCGNSCYAVRITDDSISTFEFLYHACKHHQYDFLSNQQTGSIPAVNKGQLEDFSLLVPTDCEEQRLIADFLSDFDEAITAAKKELELWKLLKKGLLQQMFV